MSRPPEQPSTSASSSTSSCIEGRRVALPRAQVRSSGGDPGRSSGGTESATRPAGSTRRMMAGVRSSFGVAPGIGVLAHPEHRRADPCGILVPTRRFSRRPARSALRAAEACGPRRPRLNASVGQRERFLRASTHGGGTQRSRFPVHATVPRARHASPEPATLPHDGGSGWTESTRRTFLPR